MEARLFKAPVLRAREAQSFISNFCGHFFQFLTTFGQFKLFHYGVASSIGRQGFFSDISIPNCLNVPPCVDGVS
jgi:hypothetical protein